MSVTDQWFAIPVRCPFICDSDTNVTLGVGNDFAFHNVNLCTLQQRFVVTNPAILLFV